MTAAQTNPAKLTEYRQRRRACSNCALHCLCFPPSLYDGRRHLEELNLRQRWIKQGDHLFLSGQRLRSLFVVRVGSVKCYDLSLDGDTMVMGFRFPGELVGLNALDVGVHAGYVIGLEDTYYCEIPLSTLHRLQNSRLELRQLVTQLLCRVLADFRSLLQVIRHLDARARLAWFLLNLASRLTGQETIKCEFRLSMDRNDIANYLGLTIGTVSRTLTDYQKAGILSARGKLIQILDVHALRKLSGSNPAVISLAKH